MCNELGRYVAAHEQALRETAQEIGGHWPQTVAHGLEASFMPLVQLAEAFPGILPEIQARVERIMNSNAGDSIGQIADVPAPLVPAPRQPEVYATSPQTGGDETYLYEVLISVA